MAGIPRLWAVAALAIFVAGAARADCPSASQLAELFNDWAIDGNEVALKTLLELDPEGLDAEARAQWTGDLALVARQSRDPRVAAHAESRFRAELGSPHEEVRREALLGLIDLVRHTRGEGGRFEALEAAFKAEPTAWTRVGALYRIEFMVKAETGLARDARRGSGRYIAWVGPFALGLMENDSDPRVRRKAGDIIRFISK